MFNSTEFQKLDFDVFSKKQLKENSLRSIYGGAVSHSTVKRSSGNDILIIPYDTIDEEDCTRPYGEPDAAGKCDAPSTE